MNRLQTSQTIRDGGLVKIYRHPVPVQCETCTVLIYAPRKRDQKNVLFIAAKAGIRPTAVPSRTGNLTAVRITGTRQQLDNFIHRCHQVREVIWSEADIPGQQTHMAGERKIGKPDPSHHVKITETEEIHEGTYEFRERMKTSCPVPIA